MTDDDTGRVVLTRRPGQRRRARLSRTANARDTIRGFDHDTAIAFGLTYGQFSMLDLLEAFTELTGPVDVSVCTWTVGLWDAERLRWLLDEGIWRSLRLVIDSSDGSKRGQATGAQLRGLFGAEAVRSTRTHAKFATLVNDDWHVLVQSSMNLNQNMRSEQFSAVDDVEACGFVVELVDEMFREMPAGGSGDRSMPGLSRIESVVPDLGLEVTRSVRMGKVTTGRWEP